MKHKQLQDKMVTSIGIMTEESTEEDSKAKRLQEVYFYLKGRAKPREILNKIYQDY